MFYCFKHIKVYCIGHHRCLVINVGHVMRLINLALSGHFHVHQSCALWSSGVTRTEDLVMENVGPAVLEASKRRCSYCSHFGATITCIVTSCARVLHFPCAAASGAFQDCKTVTMVCSQHLDQVPLLCK
jgi:histone-lysine N-methyltransferase MLL3